MSYNRRRSDYDRYDNRGGSYQNRRHNGGGARHMARIYGTEEDKTNCPFYSKAGVCRHGTNCSRRHNIPQFSLTIMIEHFWLNPRAIKLTHKDYQLKSQREQDEDYDDFFEDIFIEISECGEIDNIVVCANLGDHMQGNVYVKFFDEQDAAKALEKLNNRYYAGRKLTCQFSPVTDFYDASCNKSQSGRCPRGDYCNFLHNKLPSRDLLRTLMLDQPHYNEHSGELRRRRQQHRSSHSRNRSNSRNRSSRYDDRKISNDDYNHDDKEKKKKKKKDKKEKKKKKDKKRSRSSSDDNDRKKE